MSNRRRLKESFRRRNRSLMAISDLSEIILTPEFHSHRVRDVAARDILKLSKRHGSKNSSNSRFFICRSCESVMRFGTDSRVRVRKKSVITTCQRCDNKIRRPI